MTPLSLLDLAPIPQGGDAATALAHTRAVAIAAERLGYARLWIAEHHGLPGVASAATSVVLGHLASATQTLRLGAGGIMLPNHAPLVIAEQFGTLVALHGDRFDLGLGRAPGGDQATLRALRRAPSSSRTFPEDVVELIGLLDTPQPGQAVVAVPGASTHVPVWLLGSSLFSAQLAAHLGLPFAFASHFAPPLLAQALDAYRSGFRPSPWLARPRVLAVLNVFAADDLEDARAAYHAVLHQFVNLRIGRPTQIARAGGPPPDPALVARTGADKALQHHVLGTPDTVADGIAAFRDRTNADEIMITGMIADLDARLRSLEIVADAWHARHGQAAPSKAG